LNQDELKTYVHYDPVTGIFINRISRGGVRVGQILKCPDSFGYFRTMIAGKRCWLHRLAFLYMEGIIPDMVDHINQNPKDNRWCNLRPATPELNARNHSLQKNNTSGTSGVNFDSGKWIARIGTKKYLGSFNTKEEAQFARYQAEKELGYSPNHGKTRRQK
jgi:hypothetical protein